MGNSHTAIERNLQKPEAGQGLQYDKRKRELCPDIRP